MGRSVHGGHVCRNSSKPVSHRSAGSNFSSGGTEPRADCQRSLGVLTRMAMAKCWSRVSGDPTPARPERRRVRGDGLPLFLPNVVRFPMVCQRLCCASRDCAYLEKVLGGWFAKSRIGRATISRSLVMSGLAQGALPGYGRCALGVLTRHGASGLFET